MSIIISCVVQTEPGSAATRQVCRPGGVTYSSTTGGQKIRSCTRFYDLEVVLKVVGGEGNWATRAGFDAAQPRLA